MYQFRTYPSNNVINFETMQELFSYLDAYCDQMNLIKQVPHEKYLTSFLNDEMVILGDEVYSGFSLSSSCPSTNQRSHLLGYWSKTDCKNV